MKKKEIDLFGILLGVVIGCILGYFIFSRVDNTILNQSDPVINNQVYGTVYTVVISSEEDNENIKDKIEILDIHYETLIESNDIYYLNSIFIDINEATIQKQKLESFGFVVSIRSDYILDLPKRFINDEIKYSFYTEVVYSLLKSLTGEPFSISDEYYINPIDIEIISNLTILMNLKNEKYKNNYQLNTFCLLINKLK